MGVAFTARSHSSPTLGCKNVHNTRLHVVGLASAVGVGAVSLCECGSHARLCVRQLLGVGPRGRHDGRRGRRNADELGRGGDGAGLGPIQQVLKGERSNASEGVKPGSLECRAAPQFIDSMIGR